MTSGFLAVTDRFRSDPLMQRLFANAGLLFGGHLTSAVLNLVSIAIAARALGPADFGILAMIVSYVFIVDQIVNCQSWHAVIKYGANALESGQIDDLKSLLKFGLLVDIGTALLGAILASGGVWIIGAALGWEESVISYASAYSVLIALNVNGVPTALLRLFGHFLALSIQSTAGSILRLVLAVLAAFVGAGLGGFLLVWFTSQVAGYLVLSAMGISSARQYGLGGLLAANVMGIGAKFAGLWKYVVTTNLQSSVRLGTTQLDILVVGALLGPASAGIYTVVKRFTRVLGLVSTPLSQAIYPDLARLWSAGNVDDFRSVIRRATLGISAICLLVYVALVVAGEWLLTVLVGAEYREAYVPLVIYLGAVTLGTVSFTIYPALLAVGRPQASFMILLLSTAVYLPALYSLTKAFGVNGAAWSFVLFYGLWIPLGVVSLKPAWRKKNPHIEGGDE